jgi:hypothetical protein
MPGQGSKQLPNSLAANRTKRANAGKNPKRDGAIYAEGIIRPPQPEPEFCCDSADGSERRQVWIDKNDGHTKKCPYSGMSVDECMATRAQEQEEASLSDNLKQKLGVRYAECPSTPEATQPQCPGAPGGTFDHSPIPPDFSPTEVKFPDEDKDDVARLVSSEKTPEKPREEEEEVYVFPSDTESEDPRFIQRERELKEQRKDIETLKRAIDNIVEQTAREVDALKKENDELRDGINRALRALKKQRRMAYTSKLTEDIVDLTLE